MVEAAFDKAEAAVLETAQKFGMKVQRRLDVVTRSGLPPRFSCWVMTKAKRNPQNDGEDYDDINKNSDGHYKFPVESLTLRNADLTRTNEYSAAMEVMGWVDFEKSTCKTSKNNPVAEL
mmetsp:Transcript_18187/g.32797  ORF Transcript_18187/g.32797 Transcript_18187/m.32797 type:complete len:119 (+) Transcript_18187:1-357(+)